MFNIAMDTCGGTCDADELVRDKTVVEIDNARKRKYFCVACVGEKHAVSLNVRQDMKARNYTALAWFSHHGGGGGGNSRQDTPLPETARHWQAKHILSKHVGRYLFTTSKCKSCTKHTTVENGAGTTGRVEFSERTSDGRLYRFDAALVCGEPGSVVVRSVLEVWATHETSAEKREYCRERGYMFGEFDAAAVVDAHKNAPAGAVYVLDNLKIHVFECRECMVAREEAALRVENARLLAVAAADKKRVLAEAEEAREAKQRLSDHEFYHKTCTGAETRILQLQTELHDQWFAVRYYEDAVALQDAKLISLDVFLFDEDDILLIRDPNAWRNYHRKLQRDRALFDDIAIANGSVSLSSGCYKKGVSFKCICNKWIHPSGGRVRYRNNATQRTVWVDVHEQQVHPMRFDFMVRNGVHKQYSQDGAFVKLCGLCADQCTFCENGIEQSQASKFGCCYSCFHNVPEKIAQMQAEKRSDMAAQIALLEAEVVQMHAGDAFRGFSDFATEHRVHTQAAHHRAQLWQEEIKREARQRQHEASLQDQKAKEAHESERKALENIHKMYKKNERVWEDAQKAREIQATEDEKCPVRVLMRQNYDSWLATQVEVQHKRRERDEQSHQRWVRARAGVQGESSKRG